MNNSSVLVRATASLALALCAGACDPVRPGDGGVTPLVDATPSSDSSGGSDSSADAGVAPQDAGAQCSFVGAWQGTIASGAFAGQMLQWTFAQGTWSASIASGSVQGTWSHSSSSLEVNDTGSTPAHLACPAADRGVYTAAFDGTCATVRLTATTEPCDGRRAYADGITLTRR
jgi:hypothetical protein